MHRYKLQFDSQYLKDLKRIPLKDQEYITDKIHELIYDPKPTGCKKLKAKKKDIYRIRSGNYRVLYTIHDDILIILLLKVGHRKDVYN